MDAKLTKRRYLYSTDIPTFTAATTITTFEVKD